MKQILLFLLISTSIFAQNPTKFEKVRITSNTTSTTATKVNVQEADGTVNTITKSDLIEYLEYASAVNLPVTGIIGKIYLTRDNNRLYRWDGTIYQELTTDISGKENVANKQNSLAVDGTGIKFPTVDATNAGLALKANLTSPTFTGFVSVPDVAAGSISNQAANVRHVQSGYFRDYKNTFSNPDIFNESFHSKIGAIPQNPFGSLTGSSGYSSLGDVGNGWQLFGADVGGFRLKGRIMDAGVFSSWHDIVTSDTKIVINEVAVPNTSNFAIRALVESITDASYYNRYRVTVPNGTYFELDIRTKDYVDIQGQSQNGVIINLDGNSTVVAPTGLSIGTGGVPINTIGNNYKHIFWAVKTATVSNMTLNVSNAKYAIHQDDTGDYESTFKNVTINQGTNIVRVVGIGSRYKQKQNYINCNFNNISNNWAVGWHNWGNQVGGSSLVLDNCISEYGILIAEELGSLHDDYLTLKNCRSVQMNEFQIVSAVSYGFDPDTTPYNIVIVLDNTFMSVFQTTRANYRVFNKAIEVNNLFKAYRFQGKSLSFNTSDYNNYTSAFQTKSLSVTKDNSKIYPLLSGESTDGSYINTVSFGYTRPTTTVDGTPNGEAYIGLVGNGMLAKFWKFRADGSIFSPGQITAPSYTGSATLTGTPTAPTATVGTNTTQIATTAFVQAAARPYKVYTALLTQTGTNAPVATVLENTLGGNITWTRTAVGYYHATLTGAFTNQNKIGITGILPSSQGKVLAYYNDVNSIEFYSSDYSNVASDIGFFGQMVEIRVYQ